MLEKDLMYSELFRLYGSVLTEKRKALAEQYFMCDLSLGEIAENTGMSRQAVSDALSKTKRQLSDWEEKLGFYQKTVRMERAAELLLEEGGERAVAARTLLLSALEG